MSNLGGQSPRYGQQWVENRARSSEGPPRYADNDTLGYEPNKSQLYNALADFWRVFDIENKRFALDTLRVSNRSPTPASKTNDVLGPFDDIRGSGAIVSGRFGVARGSGPEFKKHICLRGSGRQLHS